MESGTPVVPGLVGRNETQPEYVVRRRSKECGSSQGGKVLPIPPEQPPPSLPLVLSLVPFVELLLKARGYKNVRVHNHLAHQFHSLDTVVRSLSISHLW